MISPFYSLASRHQSSSGFQGRGRREERDAGTSPWLQAEIQGRLEGKQGGGQGMLAPSWTRPNVLVEMQLRTPETGIPKFQFCVKLQYLMVSSVTLISFFLRPQKSEYLLPMYQVPSNALGQVTRIL